MLNSEFNNSYTANWRTTMVDKIKGYPYKVLLGIYAVMWLGFLMNFIFNYNHFAILPRTFSLSSFYGVLMSWSMHGNFAHLMNNSLALFPVLALTLLNEKKYKSVLAALIVGSGLIVWLLGSPAYHLGASGLIYALFGFVIASAVYRQQLMYLIFIIAALFTNLFVSIASGWIPKEHVSFSAHFGGFFIGIAWAYLCSSGHKGVVNRWLNKVKTLFKRKS